MKYTLLFTTLALTLPAFAMEKETSLTNFSTTNDQNKEQTDQDAELAQIKLFTEQEKDNLRNQIEEYDQAKKTIMTSGQGRLALMPIDIAQSFAKFALHLDEEIRIGLEELKHTNPLLQQSEQSE